MENRKKLIEVALPLDDINAACEREKSIRHGHPSTLHLWWARRPLAAARAVIWSSLVDDPSSHPEQFPTEEAQEKERERLFGILRKLVVWENSNNQEVLDAAKAEIMKSTDNNPPALLDPFCGGGAIPLEAQRLGLKAYASDLNPIPVMINKAMIEIPALFQGMRPVHPGDKNEFYTGSQGLAEDVEYYGNWMKGEAFKRIGHLYPKVKVGNNELTVIAWIWARTVKCPNPACGCEMPLVHSFSLSKKKGHECHVALGIDYSKKPPVITYKIEDGLAKNDEGTVTRQGAVCPCCGEPVGFDYIRNEGMKHIFQSRLIAIVADSVSGRIYLDPSLHDEEIASLDKPKNAPDGELAFYPGCLNTRVYGLDTFDKLFTNRQLTALTTFSSLVKDAQDKASQDALAAGLANDGIPLEKQGKSAKAYGEAIGVYLAFLVDKMTDYHSTICIWHTTGEKVANGLRRQAIPMTWDYTEGNPFSDSSGCFGNMIGWIKEVLEVLPLQDKLGSVVQWDATKDDGLRDIMVSTDPPYYDNIPYAYLADFFYIWMRASLKNTFPAIFSTLLTPKAEELTAVRYRFAGGKTEAKEFFEDGMSKTCRQIYEYSRTDIPVTIYYAFKQSESDDDGQASSGWETMLSAIINAGFAITGTWPIRTELTTALKKEMSALSTSVVIVCRKSDKPKQSISKKDFMDILQEELIGALRKLQASSIAPVDMAQSIIGPGIAVYSRYKSILQADGTAMTVRDALKLINNELDRLLNKSVGDLDAETAFCLTLFEDRAFNSMPFGQADTLARSKNTAVDKMARMDLLDSSKGQVSLKPREDLPPYDGRNTNVWLVTQQVVKEFALKGFEGAAGVFALLTASQSSQVKSMCYRLYSIADRKGWAQEALAYNSLISSWDITMDMTRTVKKNMKNEVQGNLDFGKGGND